MAFRKSDQEPLPSPDSHARREFVALSAVVGLTAFTGRSAAANGVAERDVEIRTTDGISDAAFFYPVSGKHPGVLIWTDAFGLRPSFREMGRRLASSGYAVLVPNPFYRVGKAPLYEDVPSFRFGDADALAKLKQNMQTVTAVGAAESDGAKYFEFLLAQPQIDHKRKFGVQGYCMGGGLTLRSAALRPEQVGAAASFHGGGLVTDQPSSPHLLAPKIKARVYIAVASNDDEKEPEAKNRLREAFEAAHVQAEVEVYAGAKHGWCVSDMPKMEGKPLYSRPDAERAWSKLLDLYRTALA